LSLVHNLVAWSEEQNSDFLFDWSFFYGLTLLMFKRERTSFWWVIRWPD
jgi:hypothetical protein